jgi:hypothetical protein
MSYEVLKIHANGQWTLIKSAKAPYTSPEGGISTPREQGEPDNDYKSYRSTTGQLREDHGTKGSIHGAPGNKRAPKQGQARRNWAKVPTMLPSAAEDSEPGLVT